MSRVNTTEFNKYLSCYYTRHIYLRLYLLPAFLSSLHLTKCCYFCSTCVLNSIFSRPSGNLLCQLFLPLFIVTLLSAGSFSAGIENRRLKPTGTAHTSKGPSPRSSDTPAQGQPIQRTWRGRVFRAMIRIINCICWIWTPFLSPYWAAGRNPPDKTCDNLS